MVCVFSDHLSIYQVCYTRNQVPIYFWDIGPVIKHFKVLKYYDQYRPKIFLLFSKLLRIIQIPEKNAHWTQIS